MQPQRGLAPSPPAIRRKRMGVKERVSHVALFGLLLAAACAAWAAAPTERISVNSAEVQGNSLSYDPSVSADGRFVSFTSQATNMISVDTNGGGEIFLRDTVAGTTERVSISNNEAQANADSSQSSVSSDGRYVAFTSNATNLIDGQVMTAGQVYVRDRVAGTTEIVSVSSAEVPGDSTSGEPAISGNGRYVVFSSMANNLTVDGTFEYTLIFLRDRVLGTTELISKSTGGVPGNGFALAPVINSTGTHVAYYSAATNLVDPATTVGLYHVYLRDRSAGATELVDLDSLNAPANGNSTQPTISDNGRYVAFTSTADGNAPFMDTTAQVYLRDRLLDVTELVSLNAAGGEEASEPSISGDGRYVAYSADSFAQVEGDLNDKRDIFVRDRLGVVTRVSVNAAASVQGNDNSRVPSMSLDGNHVAYESDATNLVTGDTNLVTDVFMRDLEQGGIPIGPGPLTVTTYAANLQTRLQLNWGDNSNNEVNFQLERSNVNFGTVILTPAANATAFVDSGLQPGQVYTYRIRAINACGASEWSNIDTETTYLPVPSAPFELTATPINKSEIDLVWSENSPYEDGFKIERKVGAGAFTQIGTTGFSNGRSEERRVGKEC